MFCDVDGDGDGDGDGMSLNVSRDHCPIVLLPLISFLVSCVFSLSDCIHSKVSAI